MVFYLFLLLVGAAGAAAYVVFFMTHVPGAKEERLGEFEPLPEDLGRWVEEPGPRDEGLVRERRYLWNEATGFGGGQLVLQVRYRSPETREIVRVEAEQIIPRKRVKR